jgi:hypothetical protein
MKEITEHLIESPQAPEAGGQGNLGQGHAGFVHEMLGEQHSPRLCHRNWRSSQMTHEQSPELPFAYAETLRQGLYARAATVERSIMNQGQSSGHSIGSSTP